MFNELNYSEWSQHIQFQLGVLGLDLPLHVEKPPTITDTSSESEKSFYNAWERPNRLSLMLMRMSIANHIKSTLPEINDAKEFIKADGERSQTADKSLAGTLMATLTTIKFDGSRSIHEHVVEMKNLVARLKALGMTVDDNFLVQFILNSLPPDMLVQEETRLKNQGSHSIHLITNQGAGRRVGNKKVKGKCGPLKVNVPSIQAPKKELNDVKCRFCGKSGYFQRDCLKRKAWFKKKGIPYDPNHKGK
ncbi:uncharacterized protein LOC127261971 [Andrographis paniculata]|uniref:uncharacterized protein LOC127261971 n=1 Tax=Andrographis paniculata TaxID=175694 RepID=UPI0021E92710|nr:uncharacterized protein LOC127261971 [Andrographis paniculata]